MEEKQKQNQINFGLRIQQLRKDKNWSQEELASRANSHRTYIGLIERAEREPGLNKIISLANALEVTLQELFNYEINQEPTK
ncbi:helix-turn-helix domain-containing protein [Myroides odoratimimus]|uniref:helix-turn-helix domain-containing protein n=1 Tax=Myroides odoratimimus TaxID=76832 RepID=UPI0038D4F7CA